MAKLIRNWFTKYWDDVISDWFAGQINSEQQLFLNEQSLNLNPEHMPEPYWGDPENCSIVIANYNPGGGTDRNRHTYKDCACCSDSFINQVKILGYYNVVKNFSLILQPSNSCWWRDYGGSKWWLQKMKWLQQNIISPMNLSIDIYQKKPFAIEFCGWHSVQWPSGACTKLYDNASLATVIEDKFVNALTEAVDNSDCSFGICMGSQFCDLFKKMEKKSKNVQFIPQSIGGNGLPYNIRHFIVNGQNILVIWGKRNNRYPKIPPTVQLP